MFAIEQALIACRYADSGAYAGKFRALQQRALAAVRTRVSAVLRHASEQVFAATLQLLSRYRHMI